MKMAFTSFQLTLEVYSGERNIRNGIVIILIIVVRSIFNDFGPKFTCVDPTGEQPLTGIIASIDKVGCRLAPRKDGN